MVKSFFSVVTLLVLISCSKSDSGDDGIPEPGSIKEFTVDIKQYHGTLKTDGNPMPACMILEGIEIDYNGYEKGYEVNFYNVSRKLPGAATYTDYPSSTATFLPSAARDILNEKQGNTTYTNWYNAGAAYAVTRIPSAKKFVVQYSWCSGEGVCKPDPCSTFKGKATVKVKY